MVFCRKRGRPKRKDVDYIDKGTPELQHKYKQKLTMEPLDLLLQADLINAEQHWCGLHFRWLHSLRFGTVTVNAIDPALVRGIKHKRIYTKWQIERESEWKEAQQILLRAGLYHAVRDLCIYNKMPNYHMCRGSDIGDQYSRQYILGLNELVNLWCR